MTKNHTDVGFGFQTEFYTIMILYNKIVTKIHQNII